MSQPVKSQIEAPGEGIIGRLTARVKDHWVFFWLSVIGAIVTIGVAIDQCSGEKAAPATQAAEPRSLVGAGGNDDEARAAALGGDFAPVTFVDFLDTLENESLTSLQRDTFVENHLHKRVVWEGLVRSVEGKSDSISVVLGREDVFGIALLSFSMEQRTHLLELHPMQKIKVTCVIESIVALDTPSLRECRLLRVWKQPPRAKGTE